MILIRRIRIRLTYKLLLRWYFFYLYCLIGLISFICATSGFESSPLTKLTGLVPCVDDYSCSVDEQIFFVSSLNFDLFVISTQYIFVSCVIRPGHFSCANSRIILLLLLLLLKLVINAIAVVFHVHKENFCIIVHVWVIILTYICCCYDVTVSNNNIFVAI